MGDDDYETVIEGNQEPELVPGAPEQGVDDAGYNPEAEVDGAIEGQAEGGRGKRPPARLSKAEREMLGKAIAKMNEGREPGESYADNEDVEYDEQERPAPGQKPQAAAPPTAATAQSPPAPAPALDPAVAERIAKLDNEAAELDKRAQALAAREQAADIEGFALRYLDQPVATLREFYKERGLALTDKEWEDEVADLVTDLSGQVLKVPVPSELRERIEGRRVVRANRFSRQQDTRASERLANERAQAEQQLNRQRAHIGLTKELADPKHAQAYEWLMAEQDPAGIIIEVVEDAYRRDKTQLDWKQAAQRANDYLQDKAVTDYQRRRHLLDKASKSKQGQPQRQLGARPQGTSQVTAPQRTQPETVQQPPERPAPKPAPANGRNWNEAHRRETKRMFRKSFVTEG